MYEGFRVPQDSARAVGPEVSQGSTKLCKDSTRVPQGSTMLHQGCVVRPSSEKPSDQDRFAHGRNTKQNRNQWFLAHFHCFVTCSLAQANVGFVANQITSLRNSRCSRVNAWHCCLVGFGFQELHEAARAMRSEGFRQILQKLWGSPEERFQQSFRPRLGPIALSGPARLRRLAPIAPSGPDSVRPRQLYQAGIA